MGLSYYTFHRSITTVAARIRTPSFHSLFLLCSPHSRYGQLEHPLQLPHWQRLGKRAVLHQPMQGPLGIGGGIADWPHAEHPLHWRQLQRDGNRSVLHQPAHAPPPAGEGGGGESSGSGGGGGDSAGGGEAEPARVQ